MQRQSNLLNGMAGLLKQTGLTNDPSTRFGTTLTNGLFKDHHWRFGVQLACRERRHPQSNPSARRPQVSSVPDPAFAGWSANQAPEPTPLRVTPAASAFDVLRRDKYAPVAPRSVAARL